MAEQGKNKRNKSRSQHDAQVRREDAESVSERWTDGIPLSPSWWAPAFVTILIVGLIYLVVFYLTSGRFPIPSIGNWNIAVGVGIMLVGFGMTLRWR